MDRRVLGVAVAGLVVGCLAGALALLEGPGPVDHTRMWKARPEDPPPARRPVRDGDRPTALAGAKDPSASPREARPPREGPPGEGPPLPDEEPDPAAERPRGAPFPMPPEPDTGMPPPGVMLGLPEAEVDDATLIGELAAEPFPLPERPLSDVELEALEERAAWVSEACGAAPTDGCGQAQAHLDAALSTARKVRSEADLPDPDLDPDEELAPPGGPPPGGPPPGGPPPGGPPPDGPPPQGPPRGP